MEKDKLLIIDGDFFMFTATHGNKVLDNEGNPIKEDNKFVYTSKTLEQVYSSVDWIMNDIFNKTNCDRYIGYLGNSRNFRYDIYPEYKANRKNLPKPPYFDECKQYLVDQWEFELCNLSLEADDYVNICKNQLKDQYDVIVVSNDKDLIKCTPGKFFRPTPGEIIETSKDNADYAFWTSMIVGDIADNIKGIPKCGIKHAEKVLNTDNLRFTVATEYLSKIGVLNGMDLFNLNYNLLKILDEHPDFILPEVKQYKKIEIIGIPDDWDTMKEIKIDECSTEGEGATAA